MSKNQIINCTDGLPDREMVVQHRNCIEAARQHRETEMQTDTNEADLGMSPIVDTPCPFLNGSPACPVCVYEKVHRCCRCYKIHTINTSMEKAR